YLDSYLIIKPHGMGGGDERPVQGSGGPDPAGDLAPPARRRFDGRGVGGALRYDQALDVASLCCPQAGRPDHRPPRRSADLLRPQYHGGGGPARDYLGFVLRPLLSQRGGTAMTRWLTVSVVLVLLNFIGTLLVYANRAEWLADPVPVHWNALGEADKT